MAPARFPNGLELRAASELRAAGGRRLEGYAAVFNSPAQIGGFTETVRPGACRATLVAGRDVVALADHDMTRVLGRTGSGTLRLAEDSRGLHFELDAPDTQAGRDMVELARRGDLGGCSFGFKVPPGGDTWPARHVRHLLAVDLLEISLVACWPAYSQTTVSARARQLGRAVAAAQLRAALAGVLL